MPTLFISYKRDDRVAVLPIAERLRNDFHYDIWIDAVSIPGGEDWRVEIRKGIDKASEVLLMLTPDSCASPQVKEEVEYAQSIGRKIVPLQIKRVSSSDLEALGVDRLNYIDFYGSHDTRFAWEKLLASLSEVLNRDRRLLDPNFRKLHQDYLRSLFTRYGKLSLSYLLDAAPKEQVTLFDVYVPLKLGFDFKLEVDETGIIDWWLEDIEADTPREAAQLPDRDVPRPKTLHGFQPQGKAWEIWRKRMDEGWDAYKRRHDEEEAKKEEQKREPVRLGEYNWGRLESEIAPALMPHIVVTGAPGSGKSTLLRHLALCMAGDMLNEGDEAQADIDSLGFWPLPPYTPIFVELRALVRTAFPDPTAAVTLEKFFAYIADEQLQPYTLRGYLGDLQDQLRDGDAMIFLDGLDEVPDAESEARRTQIKTLAHLLREQYPKCRIVITSRPHAYAGDWQLESFGQVKLVDLDSDRLDELARRLFSVVHGNERGEAEAKEFKDKLENIPEALRASPLFFTLMASLWLNSSAKAAQDRLPLTEGAIYRECVEMLIRRWGRKDSVEGVSLLGKLGLDETQLRQLLESLAYTVHSEAGERDDAEFSGGRILDVVDSLKLKVDIYGLRDALAHRAGVIYERAPARYQFAHRTFQEHLTARYLTAAGRFPAAVLQHLRASPANWRKVMALLPYECQQQGRDLWKLVKALLPEKDAPLPSERGDERWVPIYWAAHLMVEHLPADDELQEVYRPRLRPLLKRLIEVGALAPIDRAEMGRALSIVGDDRPGVGLRADGLPDITWADEIQPGKYAIGEPAQSANPPREIEIKHLYRVSKYLVTQAQYLAFQNDKSERGYACADWWQGLAADEDDKQPAEPAFRYDNHPMEQVNWYQAVAFCRWLTYRLRGTVVETAFLPSAETDDERTDTKNGVPTNLVIGENAVIRLPHEYEWEVAARGSDGRIYSYRGEFDATKANTSDTNIDQTSAVGIFPDGRSPCGALDMTGNVWEWCVNRYKDQDTDDLSGTDWRALRGGSWNSNLVLARAAFRVDYFPYSRNGNIGFRVALVVPHLKDR